jgi:hypothetical protein
VSPCTGCIINLRSRLASMCLVSSVIVSQYTADTHRKSSAAWLSDFARSGVIGNMSHRDTLIQRLAEIVIEGYHTTQLGLADRRKEEAELAFREVLRLQMALDDALRAMGDRARTVEDVFEPAHCALGQLQDILLGVILARDTYEEAAVLLKVFQLEVDVKSCEGENRARA